MSPWEYGPGEGGGLGRANARSPGSYTEGNHAPWWDRVEGASRPVQLCVCVCVCVCVCGAWRPTSSKLDELSSKPQATG